MILLIDNYDSFTYNLYQFIGIFNNDIKVVRNDKITIEEIEALDPESIVRYHDTVLLIQVPCTQHLSIRYISRT